MAAGEGTGSIVDIQSVAALVVVATAAAAPSPVTINNWVNRFNLSSVSRVAHHIQFSGGRFDAPVD